MTFMNENKPFFSVIVPVYNVEKYLHRCVDSILAQTYTDFEVLLIDDGSKDRSGEMCDEYAQQDNRIRVFHQENAGVSAARNKGIGEARGEYVIFVDSDDYLRTEKLNNLYQNAQEHPHFITNYKEANDIYGNEVQDNNEDVYGWAKNTCVVWNSAFLLQFLNEHQIRFCVELSHGEDTLFILDVLSYTSTIVFYDAWDYVYEKGHEGGLNQKIQNFDKELLAFQKMADARKRYYLQHGLPISQLCVSYIGEIIRIVKSLYLDDVKRTTKERLRLLRLVAANLKISNYKVNYCKSDVVIAYLFKFRQFMLLDVFMKKWVDRNCSLVYNAKKKKS